MRSLQSKVLETFRESESLHASSTPQSKGLLFVQKLAGILCAALGFIVLFGWYSHTTTLITVRPGLVPMVYNTALGFLLCGLSLLLLLSNRPYLASIGWLYALTVGLLTLGQYYLKLNLGLDTLFMGWYLGPVAFPGRMAPSTAFCFTLAGLALLLATLKRSLWQLLSVGLFGTILTAVGTVAVFGYLLNLPGAYTTWGGLALMAVHTAGGFVVLGGGLVASSLRDERLTARASRWLPVLVGIGALAMTVSLWRAFEAQEGLALENLVQVQADNVQSKLETNIRGRAVALERMAERWAVRGGTPYEEWKADAQRYLEDFSGYQGISWVDASSQVRWVMPLTENEAVVGRNLNREERRRLALETAQRERKTTVTRAVTLVTEGKGILIVVPIVEGESFSGFIVGVARVGALLDEVLEQTTPYSVSVLDGDEEIYRRESTTDGDEALWTKEATANFYGVTWTLRVWPQAKALAQVRTLNSEVALAIGLLLTFLLALSVYLAQRAKEQGKTLGTINQALQQEILERKKIQEELQRSNGDLERFAYVASHDLQEPLRTVANYTQLLGRRYKGKLDADADEFIDFAVDGAKRMQALIKDLLEFSRVGTKERVFQNLDCNVILEKALSNLHTVIEESNAVITHDPLPTVSGDPLHLPQLFQNLIGNALKFRSSETPRIHVSGEARDLEWLFFVKDNGIGLDSQFAERIFVIFQRLHTQETYKGTGMGLAICKRIVERHGGRIWVESQPNKGATFFFTLVRPSQEKARESTK